MIYRLAQFHFPDEPARLFPGTPERPLWLEIGFGDGRFWPQFARSFAAPPNYLGAEVSGVSLLKAARRYRREGLDNAHVTRLPADVLLREVIPHGVLSGIIVNFPDPWPKKDHLSQRLLRVPFFQLAASRLQPDGAVLLTTDHEEYFEFALREARDSGVMAVQEGDPPAAALGTKYALKWQELGLGARHATFTPTHHPAIPHGGYQHWPQEDSAVPHAILTTHPDQPEPLSDFQRVNAQAGGATVVLLDAYRSLRRDEWTVLAHVVEGELTQEVLVNLTRRQDGTQLVRLAKFGGPIITPGVKAAVGLVTSELEKRGAVVTHRGY